MLDFVWLYSLWLLPVPLLLRLVLPATAGKKTAALQASFAQDFALGKHTSPASNKWLLMLATIAWACLVLAASRPQLLGEPIERVINGRDLLLAVDLSGSMRERDFSINGKTTSRLGAVKHIGGKFIARRVGDRVGLILFGSQAYLQVPLTFDRKTVHTLLGESFLGLAGDKTAIGDAIGLAIKRLGQQPHETQVLILLTDGANSAGVIHPLKAAELAADYKLKIYTIGIGSPRRGLDENTLKEIAKKTGGRYFRAQNSKELQDIYRLLDKIEPIVRDHDYFRPKTELYYVPLGVALLLSAFICCIRFNWRG